MARKKVFKKTAPIKTVKRKQSFLKDIPLVKFLYASFALGTVNIIITLLLQKWLPPEVPLYYGLAKSQEQLTTSFGLIVPGVITIVVVLLNIFLVHMLGNDFLQKILVLAAFAVSIISFIATIEIVFLVGSF